MLRNYREHYLRNKMQKFRFINQEIRSYIRMWMCPVVCVSITCFLNRDLYRHLYIFMFAYIHPRMGDLRTREGLEVSPVDILRQTSGLRDVHVLYAQGI